MTLTPEAAALPDPRPSLRERKKLATSRVIRRVALNLVAERGFSHVTVEDIEAARKVFPVATVQNRYNLVDRSSEAVLEYCTANNIGFIPWFPLAAGDLAKPGTALDAIVQKTGATPGQIALAWVLKRSPVMLPIPGTSKVAHLEDNVRAADIELSDEDYRALDEQALKSSNGAPV